MKLIFIRHADQSCGATPRVFTSCKLAGDIL